MGSLNKGLVQTLRDENLEGPNVCPASCYECTEAGKRLGLLCPGGLAYQFSWAVRRLPHGIA